MGLLFLFITDEAKDESKINQHNTFIILVLFIAHMDETLHEVFFTCMRKRALIHLPFICGGWGKGIFLVIIFFYPVPCLWLTALIPDFLTNCHLAFSLSPTYSSFRTSCKQAGEFHSLGAREYT